jgi:hypothetical protein
MSATSVPNVVSERVGDAHTAVGIVAASDVDAVKIFACVASEPESSVASESLRVPFDQTSETNVPNVVKERVAFDQTELAIVEVETIVAPTTNDLSTFTKSPLSTLPQVMAAGHTPSGPDEGML